jgi:hypothetical protein
VQGRRVVEGTPHCHQVTGSRRAGARGGKRRREVQSRSSRVQGLRRWEDGGGVGGGGGLGGLAAASGSGGSRRGKQRCRGVHRGGWRGSHLARWIQLSLHCPPQAARQAVRRWPGALQSAGAPRQAGQRSRSSRSDNPKGGQRHFPPVPHDPTRPLCNQTTYQGPG